MDTRARQVLCLLLDRLQIELAVGTEGRMDGGHEADIGRGGGGSHAGILASQRDQSSIV